MSCMFSMSTGIISQKSITAVYFYNITLRIFMSQAFYTYLYKIPVHLRCNPTTSRHRIKRVETTPPAIEERKSKTTIYYIIFASDSARLFLNGPFLPIEKHPFPNDVFSGNGHRSALF